MKVTMVKKILADGVPCAKCRDIDQRLARDGLQQAVDAVVWADERDPHSEGMRLSRQLGMNRAPFFVVEDERGETECFDVYLRFKQRMARRPVQAATDDLSDLVDQHPDLALI